MRAIICACAAIIGLSLINGCGSKDHPFTEWGAAQKYHDYVPADAQIVAEGTGQLKFTPTTEGTLYLLDLSDMRQVKDTMVPHVVGTAGPLPGPEITFDPNTGMFTREGKDPVKLTTVVPGHKYQLRWEPNKPREH